MGLKSDEFFEDGKLDSFDKLIEFVNSPVVIVK